MEHQIVQLVVILDEGPKTGQGPCSNTTNKQHSLFVWDTLNYRKPLLYLDFHRRLKYYAKQQQTDKDC